MENILHSGKLYLPSDEEILKEQFKRLDRLHEFNSLKPSDLEKRQELMKEMFASIGDGCYVESPVYSNFGCGHVHFGNNVYCNFGCTFVDDTHIYVGDNTMFGPHVTLATAGHPILPCLREEGYQYNLPINIGKNCWLGAQVIVFPGVTIGDNTVIGAGSVVTKDIPSGVVAVGNPCRVLRKINEEDRIYYYKHKKIDTRMLK